MIERKLGAGLTTFAIAATILVAAPSGAGAAVSCSLAGSTATVTMATINDAATLGRSGSAIQVNGVACGAATVTNTDAINVTGTTDGGQRVAVDLTGGPLGPGATAEGGAGQVSEIEVTVDLRSGSGEEVAVVGSTGADTAVFGGAGANLNGDGDVDVTYSGLDQVEMDGNGGADTLSAGGGGASGSPLAKPGDIDGGAGSDTLTGGRSNDAIVGGPDDSTPSVIGDTIQGGSGGDTVRGNDGRDDVNGGSGGDYVDGDLGDDVLNGGPDADYINYNGGAAIDGADDISGGPDSDTLYLTARTHNLVVKLDDVANDGADTNADGVAEEGDNVHVDVEGVQGGTANDLIDARSSRARLNARALDGNGGNDSLYGGDLDDSLYGDAGNDVLDAGGEDDTLDSGAGADTLRGGDGEDSLYPGVDNDTIDAGNGDDYLDGGSVGSGADTYTGGTGFDRLYLGSRTSDLTIELDNHADDGAAGETDNYRSDIERIEAGSGNDNINVALGVSITAANDNEIYGGGGNDTIKSGPGEDYVEGGLGNDTITGGDGEDRVFGLAGADRFLMADGFFDHVDGGAGDGVNDTGTFDSFDEKLNFP